MTDDELNAIAMFAPLTHVERAEDGLTTTQEDIEDLVAEVREQRAKLEIARDALRYYADRMHHTEKTSNGVICVLADGGDLARQALAESKP